MKKIGIVTIVVLVLLAITYMLVGNYFYNYALNAKQEKEFLEDNPHLVETANASGGVFATDEEKDASFV
ncbi:TPA: alpha/beta hydrolase, partial [Streptococcus agalactiae]